MIIGITGTLGAGKGTTLRAAFGVWYLGASLFGRTTLPFDLGNWQKFDFNSMEDLL